MNYGDGSFSTKLHRVKSHAKDYPQSIDGAKEESLLWTQIKKLFSQATSLTSAFFQSPDMINNYNYSYLGYVYVGTPPQEFLVIWDTGSGAFLLRSTACTNCMESTRQLDMAASSSFNYL